MSLAVSEQELRQLLVEESFIRLYHFELISIGEGESSIRVPFQKEFLRPGGIVSGPVYMAAADLAVWLAIITKVGMEEGRMTVTAEMKTSFMSVGKEEFRCKARLLKVGKRLIYGLAECLTPSDQLLTHHTLTYIRPTADSGAASIATPA